MNEPRCPRCPHQRLIRHPRAKNTQTYSCPGCQGALLSLGVLRGKKYETLVARLWNEALTHARVGVTCPLCLKPSHAVMLDQRVEIDLCRPCMSLWFDVGELTSLPDPEAKGSKVPAHQSPASLRDDFLKVLIDHLPTSLGDIISRWLAN